VGQRNQRSDERERYGAPVSESPVIECFVFMVELPMYALPSRKAWMNGAVLSMLVA